MCINYDTKETIKYKIIEKFIYKIMIKIELTTIVSMPSSAAYETINRFIHWNSTIYYFLAVEHYSTPL